MMGMGGSAAHVLFIRTALFRPFKSVETGVGDQERGGNRRVMMERESRDEKKNWTG